LLARNSEAIGLVSRASIRGASLLGESDLQIHARLQPTILRRVEISRSRLQSHRFAISARADETLAAPFNDGNICARGARARAQDFTNDLVKHESPLTCFE